MNKNLTYILIGIWLLIAMPLQAASTNTMIFFGNTNGFQWGGPWHLTNIWNTLQGATVDVYVVYSYRGTNFVVDGPKLTNITCIVFSDGTRQTTAPTNAESWSQFVAQQTVDLDDNNMTNVLTIHFTGDGFATNVIADGTSSDSSSVHIASTKYVEEAVAARGGNTNWSASPAQQDVDVNNWDLNNVTDLNAKNLIGVLDANIITGTVTELTIGGASVTGIVAVGTSINSNSAVLASSKYVEEAIAARGGGGSTNWSASPAQSLVNFNSHGGTNIDTMSYKTNASLPDVPPVGRRIERTVNDRVYWIYNDGSSVSTSYFILP